jgi:opacity protein-like surface antigen
MKKLLLVVGLVLLASNAIAQEKKFELTPFGAYRFGGTFNVEESNETYKLSDSSSYGVMLDIRQKKQNTQVEIIYSRQQTDASYSAALPDDPNIDVDIQILQIGGTVQGDGDTVRPYLAATIGGTHIVTRAAGKSSDTFWSGSLGVGFQFKPTSRLGIRLEARGYATLVSSNSSIFCESGPEGGACLVQVDGKMLSQFEAILGVVFRF